MQNATTTQTSLTNPIAHELAGIRHTILVEIAPHAQLRERGVGGVHHPVVIRIKVC